MRLPGPRAPCGSVAAALGISSTGLESPRARLLGQPDGVQPAQKMLSNLVYTLPILQAVGARSRPRLGASVWLAHPRAALDHFQQNDLSHPVRASSANQTVYSLREKCYPAWCTLCQFYKPSALALGRVLGVGLAWTPAGRRPHRCCRPFAARERRFTCQSRHSLLLSRRSQATDAAAIMLVY